jgi:hypothetical protein
MTHDPSPVAASMSADIIQVPFPIRLRAVQLYWELLQTLLAQRDHQVTLDRIEPAPTGQGWLIHFMYEDPATIGLLHEAAANGCSPTDPLALLLS